MIFFSLRREVIFSTSPHFSVDKLVNCSKLVVWCSLLINHNHFSSYSYPIRNHQLSLGWWRILLSQVATGLRSFASFFLFMSFFLLAWYFPYFTRSKVPAFPKEIIAMPQSFTTHTCFVLEMATDEFFLDFLPLLRLLLTLVPSSFSLFNPFRSCKTKLGITACKETRSPRDNESQLHFPNPMNGVPKTVN